ncbi:MAG TPA: glutathione S-transferase C-terminal domain-containing protein [Solirubrobacteraceae bacterium]|nr:glutathione S-transferase C-terminal domain-containing protein [Solirubrobacteraceae bacterium]
MAQAGQRFSLGREAGRDGRFHRQASAFRDRPERAEAGRYVLYVCRACPWAHRTIIARRLLGLEDAIELAEVDPIRDERGWAFTGGPYVDPHNGFRFLSEAYAATDPSFDGRYSVPVLWDKRAGRIVNNESGDLLRILNDDFRPLATTDVDLYPPDLRPEIEPLEERIYETLNNGVYRTGFATTQEAYEEGFFPLFETLDWLEERLSRRRYLVDDERITAVDWRLFTTLVRFDSVYYLHFKCNRDRIVDLPALWGYLRDLYQQPGIAETVDLDAIKRHYYGTHGSINPHGIVPAGPRLDLSSPHGREALAAQRQDRTALA